MSPPEFSFTTTAEEVAAAFANEITGKNVLITGTSIGGIGFETARVVAKHANLVIITGYSEERLHLSKASIKKEIPSANIRPLVLDLSSLAAVRKAAAEVNAYAEPIHVLIHNAAAPIGPFKLTIDHLDTQMATSHFGPFLFTKLISPKLLAAETTSYTPRVIFVSSAAHAFCGGVNFDTFGTPSEEKYQPTDAYFQAKCANILMGMELSKRASGRIKAYSLHPGIIHTNTYMKEESIPELQALGILRLDGTPNTDAMPWKTIPQGAATTIAAAFDPKLKHVPGAYLDDCTVANDKVAPHSSDQGNAKKLWDLTEDIIGEKFLF